MRKPLNVSQRVDDAQACSPPVAALCNLAHRRASDLRQLFRRQPSLQVCGYAVVQAESLNLETKIQVGFLHDRRLRHLLCEELYKIDKMMIEGRK